MSNVTMDDIRPLMQGLAKRLDYIEQHPVLLGQAVGYAYAPYGGDGPPEVKELMRAGKTLEAIKRYREATGASLAQAQEYVNSL